MSTEGTTDAEPVESPNGTKTVDGVGLEPNVAGALAYVFGLLSGVVMLVLASDHEFVRFHALQSIGFSVVVGILYVFLGVVSTFVVFIPGIGGLLAALFGLVYPLVGLGGFVGWAFLLYKAYSGERFELPVIGSIAAAN